MGRILSPSNGASKLSAPSIPHRQLSMSKQNYSRNPKYIQTYTLTLQCIADGWVGGQLHLLLVSRFSLRFLKFSLSKEKISLRSIFQYYPCRSFSYGSADLSLAISQMSQYCYRYRSEKLPDNGPALGDTDTETRWASEHRQRQSNAPSGSHNVSNFYIYMNVRILCLVLCLV